MLDGALLGLGDQVEGDDPLEPRSGEGFGQIARPTSLGCSGVRVNAPVWRLTSGRIHVAEFRDIAFSITRDAGRRSPLLYSACTRAS